MVIISKNSLIIQSIINTKHLMNIHVNEFEFFLNECWKDEKFSVCFFFFLIIYEDRSGLL